MASYQSTRYYDSSDNKDCLFTYNETRTTIQEATTGQKKKIRVAWNITFNVYTHNTNNATTGAYMCSVRYTMPDKAETSSRASRKNGDVVVTGSFDTDATSYYCGLAGAIYVYSENVSWTATLDSDAGYTLGTAGSASIIDNGDNTFTVNGVAGNAGENNNMTACYLTYRTDNKPCTWPPTDAQASVEMNPVSGATASKTESNKEGVIWAGDLLTYAMVVTNYQHNFSMSDNVFGTIKYYKAPTDEVTFINLEYSGTAPTMGQVFKFTWNSAVCDLYRIWFQVNGVNQYGIDPNHTELDFAEISSSSTTYTIPTSITSKIKANDVVKLAVQDINVDKKNNYYYGGVYNSDDYTVVSTALMNVKVSDTWKKGSPHVKVDGVWKSAVGVFVKTNGVWKQSI